MRPILAVPRITGMKSVRLSSIELSLLSCRLLDHSTLELDDLPALLLRQPASVRWFEVLRDIKLNHSRHNKPPTNPAIKIFFPAGSLLSVRFQGLREVTNGQIPVP